jgi:hypothetical protein
MLAAVLLILNGRPKWIGEKHNYSWATAAVLFAGLLLFLLVGGLEIRDQLAAAH